MLTLIIGGVVAGLFGYRRQPWWQAALLLLPLLALGFIGFRSASAWRAEAGLELADPALWLASAAAINLAVLSACWWLGRLIARRRGAQP